MKKVICAFLCFVLVVLLCACSAPDDAHSDNNTSEITQTEHTTTEQVVTTTEKYTLNDVMNSIRAFLNPDMSHKISFEYMNLALYGFSRDIEQKLCKDGSFSYFVNDHQWDHTSGYDNTESREFYYRYEDEAFVCYMKDPEGEISHVEVSQKVIDSMAADKVKIVSAEALVPSYAQAFTEVLEGAQYTFSLSVREILEDETLLSSFLYSIFTMSGYEYDSSLGLNILCTIDVSKTAENEYRPVKISYDFEEIKPFVLSNGAISGEYALDTDFITMSYEFDYSLAETVDIPAEFFPST